MPTTTRTPEFYAPADAGFADAVASWNVSRALGPAAAATATSVADVRALVRAAAAVGAPIAPMTTGHRVEMMSDHPGLHIIRTRLDDDIVVDTERETVTIPAGSLWGAVVEKVNQAGYTVPHGSSPTVGAVGYLLGGGMSFYGRAWGVAANHIESLSLVVADGSQITVDAESDAGLFWAIRGGGGGFGVVTSITMRMTRLDAVVTGMTVWPAEHAARLLEAWRRWTRTAPDLITTSFRLMNLPPLPGLPPQMTGGQIAVVDGTALPDRDGIAAAQRTVDELSDLLRIVAPPALDTWHVGPPSDVIATHGDPVDPLPVVADAFTIDDFTAEAAGEWLSVVGPGGSTTLLDAELRQLGGAFRNPPSHGGVYDRLGADVLVESVDLVLDPGDGAAAVERTMAPRRGLADRVGRLTAPTFTHNLVSPRRSYDEAAEEAVGRVRRRVDPDGLFAEDVTGPYDGRGVQEIA